jgi:signal transduction histidine kinase
MEEIDVAVFALDAERRVRLVNRAGERLLDTPAARLLGRRADDTGLVPTLGVEPGGALQHAFPGGGGRWQVRRAPFRLEGRPHELLVIGNVSRVLREEERQAWERLIRVLGHEINNSLAPIQSIAGTLRGLMDAQPRPADLDDDLRSGLGVIATRSEALGRFLAAYARMARLPPPEPAPVDVGAWVRRAVALETRLPVRIVPSPDAVAHADPDQLDQLLINLLRNAVDAALETGGGVRVGWERRNGSLLLWVDDDGPGLPESANLFVPFFTTKPLGSGIGLALSRQIAEAHGGTLTLENRADARGARASLLLPGMVEGS